MFLHHQRFHEAVSQCDGTSHTPYSSCSLRHDQLGLFSPSDVSGGAHSNQKFTSRCNPDSNPRSLVNTRGSNGPAAFGCHENSAASFAAQSFNSYKNVVDSHQFDYNINFDDCAPSIIGIIGTRPSDSQGSSSTIFEEVPCQKQLTHDDYTNPSVLLPTSDPQVLSHNGFGRPLNDETVPFLYSSSWETTTSTGSDDSMSRRGQRPRTAAMSTNYAVDSNTVLRTQQYMEAPRPTQSPWSTCGLTEPWPTSFTGDELQAVRSHGKFSATDASYGPSLAYAQPTALPDSMLDDSSISFDITNIDTIVPQLFFPQPFYDEFQNTTSPAKFSHLCSDTQLSNLAASGNHDPS